jgi:hypothetical protein
MEISVIPPLAQSEQEDSELARIQAENDEYFAAFDKLFEQNSGITAVNIISI